jgi:hypothetical protein
MVHVAVSCRLFRTLNGRCMLSVLRGVRCAMQRYPFAPAACRPLHPPLCASHVACCRPKFHVATLQPVFCMLHAAALPVASCLFCMLHLPSCTCVCVACSMLHVASGLLHTVNSCCILSICMCVSVACRRACKLTLSAACGLVLQHVAGCTFSCCMRHVAVWDVVRSARCTSVASCRLCMPCAGQVARVAGCNAVGCMLPVLHALPVAGCMLRCMLPVARFALHCVRCMLHVSRCCCMLHAACIVVHRLRAVRCILSID